MTNENAYLKKVMKTNFELGIVFSKNLMECKIGKIRVLMDKPVYLGQAILNLSKIIMYEFHYNYMKPEYSENLQLCYTDTNYDIKTDHFYKHIASNVRAWFSTSGCSRSRPFPLRVNKKVIGLMKDKLAGSFGL